jgi:uncharacterized protein YndB with AHSA1/START domain
MAATTITPDQDAVVSEIRIAAPAERVFQALVDPKQVMSWWTGEEAPIESFTMDKKRGGRWSYHTKQASISHNGVSKFHCEGEVLEYDPPRVLAYTWVANWQDHTATRSVVRWELTPKGKETHLKLTHSGLKNLPDARKDYSGGWPGLLEQIKALVEK